MVKEESIVERYAKRCLAEKPRLNVADIDIGEGFFQNPHIENGFTLINNNGVLHIKGGSRNTTFPVELDMEKHFESVRRKRWFIETNANTKIWKDLVVKKGPYASQWHQYFADIGISDYLDGLTWGLYHPVIFLLRELQDRVDIYNGETNTYGV